MNKDEAKKLLEIWDWFEKHPDMTSFENMPRATFFQTMLVVTRPFTGRNDDLVAAKQILESLASGGVSGNMPAEIIERVKSGEISQAEVANIEKTTNLTRDWITKLAAKTPEKIIERQVAAAQVQAMTERIVPEKPTVVPEISPVEPPSPIGIKITPETKVSVEKFTARIASAPFRTAVLWAAPTLAAEDPQKAAGLTLMAYGISSSQLTKKLNTLPDKEIARLEEIIKVMRGLETDYFKQMLVIRQGIAVRDINFVLGKGIPQSELAIFSTGKGGAPQVVERGGFFGNILKQAGQQLFGKAASSFIRGATTKLAAAGAEAATGIGAPVAAASLALDALSLIRRYGGKFLIAAGIALFAGGYFIGGAAAAPLAISGVSLAGIGAIGEAGGVGNALSKSANFTSNVLTGLTSLVVASIATPLIATLIGLPLVVALILFIINSGAYLVPPSESITANIGQSPYIQVKKEADTSSFENKDLPKTVNYKITVSAPLGSLSNISFKNDCQVFKNGSPPPCSHPIPAEIPKTIDPGVPFEFSYSQTYTGTFTDSLVSDTFSVTADAADQKGANSLASASIIIGKPPVGCFDVRGSNWPANLKTNVLSAVTTLTTNFPKYAAKVCAGGKKTLPIVYDPSKNPGGWGYYSGGVIYFNGGGLGSQINALYLLTHEAGHHLAKISDYYKKYVDTIGVDGERPLCSYSNTGDPSEAFAEAFALYATNDKSSQWIGRCGGTFKVRYPHHWQFASDVFNK